MTLLAKLLFVVQASLGSPGPGFTKANIRAAFGQPDFVFNAKPELVYDKKVVQVWEYGTKDTYHFPYMRTIYFDSNGKALMIFAPPRGERLNDQELRALDSLDRSSGVMGLEFNPVAVVAAAEKLWKLGKTDALRVIKYYEAARPLSPIPDEGGGEPFMGKTARDFEDYRVCVVLWILFPPKTNPGIPDPTFLAMSPVPADRGVSALPLFETQGVPIMLSEGLMIHDPTYQDRLLRFCEQQGRMVSDAPQFDATRHEVANGVERYLRNVPNAASVFYKKMIERELAQIPN